MTTQTAPIPTTKPSYKHTPLGWIPKDWEVKKLGDLIDEIVGGGTPSREIAEYWNGTIFWATVKDISSFNPKNTEETITEEGLRNSASNLIPKGTLITATRMALGKAVCYDVDVAINQDLKAIFPKSNLDNKFLFYWFGANANVIEGMGNGSTVKGITLDDLKKLPFLEIPVLEQKAIAAVLSTWDRGIETLTRLLEQKQLRKKWLMQQLLTGKKRLKGFMGEWKEVRLGEITVIKTGDKDNQDKVEDGEYPFFVRSDKVERINSYSYDGEAILIPGEGRIGEIFHYVNGKFNYHQRVYKISDFTSETAGIYIYYYLKHFFIIEVTKHSVKATVDSLRLPTFKEMIINLPSKKEQTAIASVLQTADKEIQLLQNQLTQLKEQKKGLMQVLLTGKKRVKIQ